MKKASIPCNIVILPNAELEQKAIVASQKLAQINHTFFTLKDGEYYPHVTLYMTQLKTEDLPRVEKILSDLAASTSAPTLQADRYELNAGYFDANYERTSALEALQQAVIAAIDPIRDGMRQKDKDRLPEETGLARENLEKYGYRGVGDLFRPHITLTRLTDNHGINHEGLLEPQEFSGSYLRLGLFEMGDNGTCVRKIAVFPLVD